MLHPKIIELWDDWYNDKVIWLWDKASWNFLEACNKAIEELTIRHLLKKNWNTWKVKTWENINWINKKNPISSVTESIDWVWTKIQIYSEIFNSMIEDFENEKIWKDEIMKVSVDLWERMLSDLIAMNVDDLREWEMAISVTNIIDINHLEWPRWHFFAESMKIALYNISKKLDIAITAGETAILWDNEKVPKIVEDVATPQRIAWITSTSILDILLDNEKIQKIINKDPVLKDFLINHVSNNEQFLISCGVNTVAMVSEIIEKSFEIYEDAEKCLKIILKDISFNIWWTGLWVIWNKEKLTEIKKWQSIMYFQEVPDENGIIWPRSNGITRIRKVMKNIAWKWWMYLTFEEFLDKIGEEQSNKLPKRLKNECRWLKMWQIATWKTTVFNPFISRVLLWWLENNPIANISSVIHVTWNPWKKIANWLKWNTKLAVELDISDVKIPQIIEIIQILWDIKDKDAIWSFNMWVPKWIIYDDKYTEFIKYIATKHWYIGKKIWKVVERNDAIIAWTIKWVWIWKSEIEIKDDIKKYLTEEWTPDLRKYKKKCRIITWISKEMEKTLPDGIICEWNDIYILKRSSKLGKAYYDWCSINGIWGWFEL